MSRSLRSGKRDRANADFAAMATFMGEAAGIGAVISVTESGSFARHLAERPDRSG